MDAEPMDMEGWLYRLFAWKILFLEAGVLTKGGWFARKIQWRFWPRWHFKFLPILKFLNRQVLGPCLLAVLQILTCMFQSEYPPNTGQVSSLLFKKSSARAHARAYPHTHTLCCIGPQSQHWRLPLQGRNAGLGTQAQHLWAGLNRLVTRGIFVPQPGIERTSPTLQGGFFTTRPPKKLRVPFSWRLGLLFLSAYSRWWRVCSSCLKGPFCIKESQHSVKALKSLRL